jgi:hypothetical protein
MNIGDEVYIGFPSAVHYGEKGSNNSHKGKKPVNQLLWGDWARIDDIKGNWFQVRSRRRDGWVRKENLQTNRLLEVNFVDIGQGDGCHIQTPEDRAIIIDAGEGDNMYRFLRWRFGRFANRFDFESFVITHPDKDHYYGFTDLLEHDNVHAETIYHNCIVEQISGGKSSLGKVQKFDRKNYLTGLVQTKAELKQITDSSVRRGKRLYPNLLKKALDSGRVEDIVGILASEDQAAPNYLPGYAPEDGGPMTMVVLGPVPRTLGNGKAGLPRLGADGVTPEAYEILVQEARRHFQVDIAKAFHHGGAHVSPVFLDATNPLATVVSSGDNEPHSHPRPDTLGIIGKYSRSERPLIFSTELARSGNETIKHPNRVRAELRAKIEKESSIIHDPASTDAQVKAARERLDKHLNVIQRSVANYGMINVRTDGQRLIIAQRLERKRSKSTRWDIYEFESDAHGRLTYQH